MFSLTGVSPPEGSKRNPLDTLIEFTIVWNKVAPSKRTDRA